MSNKEPMVRTRFSPSPTGWIHCGGIKTAIVSWLYAKKHGGEFLLRIEDTDSKRFVPEAEQYIIDALNWMGLTPDHGPGFGDGRYGPYRQSEREYRPYVDKLLKDGHAYYAFDTEEELSAMRKKCDAAGKKFSYDNVMRGYMRNSITLSSDDVDALLADGVEHVIRFKMPKGVDVRFTDHVRGTVVFNTDTLDDKVLFKSNGMVSYHMANVADDHRMDITHVFRGEEWLSSTPLHLLLYDALGWKAPEFAHLPLLLDKNGKKMSKRNAVAGGYPMFPFTVNVVDDDGTILGESTGFKELSYDPDALLNYLSLLGWHPKDDKEIMTREELIAAFDIDDVNSAGAKFDPMKAAYFNREYLSRRPASELVKYLPENVFGYTDEALEAIAKAATERAHFTKDIAGVVEYFFRDVDAPIEAMKKTDEFQTFLGAAIPMMETYEWDPERIYDGLLTTIANLEVHRGSALNNLRLCLTGGASGPQLREMMSMMGKAEFLRRLRKAQGALATLG